MSCFECDATAGESLRDEAEEIAWRDHELDALDLSRRFGVPKSV